MSVTTTPEASEKATVIYDAFIDRDSQEAEEIRQKANAQLSESIGNLNNLGNHELGHILESTLNPTVEDQHKDVGANDILQTVLPNVLTQDELNQVQYNQQDGKGTHDISLFQGQINTESPIFEEKKMSSPYGRSSPKEWFAEAFHDVYTKGADAQPISIEIVKEYEKRQKAKQIASFRKKERGWFTRAKRWFSRKFNFGTRRGAAQMAPVPDLAQPANLPRAQASVQQPMQEPALPMVPPLPENLLEPEIGPNLQQNKDMDMVVEAPKRKKLKKKKKK